MFEFFSVPAREFIYTNQGNSEEIENINDREVFKDTLEAFKLLGKTKLHIRKLIFWSDDIFLIRYKQS